MSGRRSACVDRGQSPLTYLFSMVRGAKQGLQTISRIYGVKYELLTINNANVWPRCLVL